jgi:hypothetical protein
MYSLGRLLYFDLSFSAQMVEIQRILMLQKDFDPMGIRQKNFKLAQEQEKKTTAAFHKRAHHLLFEPFVFYGELERKGGALYLTAPHSL